MRHAALYALRHAGQAIDEGDLARLQALFDVVYPHLDAIVLSFVGIGACTVIVILFLRRVEQRVHALALEHEDVEGRILGLEVKEYTQDERLEGHDQSINNQARFIVKIKKEVDELGRDVGWDDNKRLTQVMPKTTTEDLLDELKKPKS